MVHVPFDHQFSPRVLQAAKHIKERQRGSYACNPIDVADVYDRVATFRDTFLEWVKTYPDGYYDEILHDDTLWDLFSHWVSIEWNDLNNERRKPVWLDRRRRYEAWDDFLRLVPLIYIAVIEKVVQQYVTDHCDTDVDADQPAVRVLPTGYDWEPEVESPARQDPQYLSIVEWITGADGLWPALVDVSPRSDDDLLL